MIATSMYLLGLLIGQLARLARRMINMVVRDLKFEFKVVASSAKLGLDGVKRATRDMVGRHHRWPTHISTTGVSDKLDSWLTQHSIPAMPFTAQRGEYWLGYNVNDEPASKPDWLEQVEVLDELATEVSEQASKPSKQQAKALKQAKKARKQAKKAKKLAKKAAKAKAEASNMAKLQKEMLLVGDIVIENGILTVGGTVVEPSEAKEVLAKMIIGS